MSDINLRFRICGKCNYTADELTILGSMWGYKWFNCEEHGLICSNCTDNPESFIIVRTPTCSLCNNVVKAAEWDNFSFNRLVTKKEYTAIFQSLQDKAELMKVMTSLILENAVVENKEKFEEYLKTLRLSQLVKIFNEMAK